MLSIKIYICYSDSRIYMNIYLIILEFKKGKFYEKLYTQHHKTAWITYNALLNIHYSAFITELVIVCILIMKKLI